MTTHTLQLSRVYILAFFESIYLFIYLFINLFIYLLIL